MEWKSSYRAAPPARPARPAVPAMPAMPALPPPFSHHTHLVAPQERQTQDVGMAVSMDTISIVTMWGGGGRGVKGKGWGELKGSDKNIYI